MRWLERADLVLHAGDFVLSDVLEQLRGFRRFEAVHGNMDEEGLRRTLPKQQVVEVGQARIGLVHDAGRRKGRADRLAARFPDCDAVVYGHTHLPEASRHGRMLVLNPGSPTERRRSPTPSFLLLHVAARTIEPELVLLSDS